MPHEILYEFNGFRLDPSRGVLLRDGQPTKLRAKPFKLLLTLVENHGESIRKEELIKRVWLGSYVSDINFHVNMHSVRTALGESRDEPRFIFRSDDGYKFVADVKVIPAGSKEDVSCEEPSASRPTDKENSIASETAESQQVAMPPNSHVAHLLVSCALYAALYSSAVFLETAYEFDRYGRSARGIAAIVFGWMMGTSVLGLVVDRKQTARNRTGGFPITVVIFFAGAACVLGCLTRFLPNQPITQAAFQTYPAQAAYLKDTVYFLLLALIFQIVPFHFIAAAEHEIREGRYRSVRSTLTMRRLAVLPSGTIYLRFGHLSLLLVMFAMLSIAMTAHLLDNLRPGPYRNLFTQLVYLRGVLYFGLGIECLAWYHSALAQLKSVCLTRT
jgi:DNA-binding winged helix-turn-helix (wHTH) protein